LEYYANDARSQDINTVRYAIPEVLPLNPHVDAINPPIVGSKKNNRGWNHNATAAALCPLRLCAEFDEDPLYVSMFRHTNNFTNVSKTLSGQGTQWWNKDTRKGFAIVFVSQRYHL